MLANARRGAERAGRTLPRDFYVSGMVTLAMLRPGEAIDSGIRAGDYGALELIVAAFLAFIRAIVRDEDHVHVALDQVSVV